MAYQRWSDYSDWYIYGHANCGNLRKDQTLAICHCNAISGHYLYNDVKKAYENNDWTMLGLEGMTQKDELILCVEHWLEDVHDYDH